MVFIGSENFWFVRSNPRFSSWESVLKKGYFTLRGIKNYQAAKSLSAMKPGDLALFYEIEPSKSIRGILEVAGSPYPDPGLSGEKFYAVDFHVKQSLDYDLSLSMLKAYPQIATSSVSSQPRVFALPLDRDMFHFLLKLSSEEVIYRDSFQRRQLHPSLA